MTEKQVLEEIIAGLPEVRVSPMMGEHVLYCREKVVGDICDNKLFVKITPVSKNYLEGAPEVPPYVGAKPYYLVENTQNKAFISELLLAVADALPAPKKRK